MDFSATPGHVNPETVFRRFTLDASWYFSTSRGTLRELAQPPLSGVGEVSPTPTSIFDITFFQSDVELRRGCRRWDFRFIIARFCSCCRPARCCYRSRHQSSPSSLPHPGVPLGRGTTTGASRVVLKIRLPGGADCAGGQVTGWYSPMPMCCRLC